MPYLIDGHNLIAALPDLSLDDPDDEVKLVLKLRAWCAQTGRKAIVYFDGGQPGGIAHHLSTSRLQVIFAAAQRSSADALIKAHLQRLKDARNWTVVTSDRDILAAAYRRGAHGRKSQDFAAELTQSVPAAAPDEDLKPTGVMGEELQAWLEIFSSSEEKAAHDSEDTDVATPPSPAPAQDGPRGRNATPPRLSPQPTESARPGVPLGELAPALKALRGDAPAESTPEVEAPHGEKPPLPTPEEIEAWLREFPEAPDEPIAPPPPKPAPPRRLPPGQEKPTDITREELAEWLYRFGGGPYGEKDTPQEDEDADTMARLFGPRRPPRKK